MKRYLYTLCALVTLNASVAFAGDTVKVEISGMTCGSCVNAVQTKLKTIDGIESVKVDLESETATITVKDGAHIADEAIAQKVKEAGYKAETIDRG